MSKQPEALRLAELLDGDKSAHHEESATELRRLYEVNQELLEVLQNLCEAADNGHVASYSNLWDDARAAIAKATGESNE